MKQEPPTPAPWPWKSVGAITAVALAVFGLLSWAGRSASALSHRDFRPAGSAFRPEYCDPSRPAFIPAARLPPSAHLHLVCLGVPEAGRTAELSLRLSTASGRPVGPEDLALSHTRLLHLLVVDPTLGDYQHLHPEPDPSGGAGAWRASFVPRRGGVYRFFADFTPRATGRGLFATADLAVGGTAAGASADPAGGALGAAGGVALRPYGEEAPRAGRLMRLRLPTALGEDGARLPWHEVMGAAAHAVAFDAERSGFAHLHPVGGEGGPLEELQFEVSFPTAGRYRVWFQAAPGGREVFAPLDVVVAP